jgi:hypothetical protein
LFQIVACVRDKQQQFANLLYKAMKGAGTKDDCLIRIIVSRSEIDMVQIKQKFQSAHSKDLASMISVIKFFIFLIFIIIGSLFNH